MKILSSILDKKIDKNKSRKIWGWLQQNGFDHPDSLEQLLNLRRSGGGWLYYSELADSLNLSNIPDDAASLVIKILTDSYEGGNWRDGNFNIASNEKDIIIQNALRSQLNNPKGKLSYYEALINADTIASGYDLYNIVDASIKINGGSIGIKDSYSIRLKYSMNLPDILVTNIAEINGLSAENQNFLRGSIYEIARSSIDSEKTVYDDALKRELKIFLDNNKVVIDAPEPIPEEGYEFRSLDELNKWKKEYETSMTKQQSQISEYAKWIEAYAVSEGVLDIDSYIYNRALTTSSIPEKIAIIQAQAIKAAETSDDDGFLLYSQNSDLKHQLREALNQPSTDQAMKDEIQYALETYFTE